MTRIYQTDLFPPGMKVQAEMYHRSRGDGRVRVIRRFTLSHRKDGCGMEEYVLTRYEDKKRAAASSILAVEGQGYELAFREVRCCPRKGEGEMIMQWCEEMGQESWPGTLET